MTPRETKFAAALDAHAALRVPAERLMTARASRRTVATSLAPKEPRACGDLDAGPTGILP